MEDYNLAWKERNTNIKCSLTHSAPQESTLNNEKSSKTALFLLILDEIKNLNPYFIFVKKTSHITDPLRPQVLYLVLTYEQWDSNPPHLMVRYDGATVHVCVPHPCWRLWTVCTPTVYGGANRESSLTDGIRGLPTGAVCIIVQRFIYKKLCLSY